MANTLNLFRNGAVGSIDWLDAALCIKGAMPGYDEAAASVYIWGPVLELELV